jgi:hypothetical protein
LARQQKSKRIRCAYKLAVEHFMRTLMIKSDDELRQVGHRAVIACERIMREIDGVLLRPSAAGLRRSPVFSSIWSATTTSRKTPSPKPSGPPLTARKARRSLSSRTKHAGCWTFLSKLLLKGCATVRFLRSVYKVVIEPISI